MESLRKKHDILSELIGQRIVSIQTDDAGQPLTDVYFETDDFTFRAQATYENLTEIVAVTRKEISVSKNAEEEVLKRANLLKRYFDEITTMKDALSGQQSINVAREFINQLGAYTPFEWKPQPKEADPDQDDMVTVPRNQLADYCP